MAPSLRLPTPASPWVSPIQLTPTWFVTCASPYMGLSKHPGTGTAKSDTSLFIFHRGSNTVYLLLYVDDIILTASSTELLCHTIFALQQEFTMKDLRPLHHILGTTVERRPDRLFLHHRTYTLDIIKWAVMADCNPCTTPVDLQVKLADDSGPPVADTS
jgi:hypothetical protein